MPRVLLINSSLNGEGSVSRSIALELIDRLKARHVEALAFAESGIAEARREILAT